MRQRLSKLCESEWYNASLYDSGRNESFEIVVSVCGFLEKFKVYICSSSGEVLELVATFISSLK